MAKKLNQSSLTKCTVTPPHLNRQHSYGLRQDSGRNATSALATVASRTASPGRKSPTTSPFPSPSDRMPSERRTSWEECKVKRDGYISFPDFDQLRESQQEKPTT